MKTCFVTLCLLLAQASVMAGTTTGTVRVAAIQCPSAMNRTADNLSNITNLVRQAASRGARIVVLPECAVQGYLDPTTWTSWSSSDPGATDVRKVAETVPGPSTLLLSGLAKGLGIYLCAGLIESASNVFYNSQVLLDPHGMIIAHHRKRALWTPGDSTWCTAGDLPVQVVDTEYGRIGLMICFDFHVLPPLLAKGGADIVLYSVGWYGPNEENWFGKVFPEKAVIPYGLDVVAANWTSPTEDEQWPGRGHSCIITREGKVLAMSQAVCGNDIVFADLKIKGRDRQDLATSGTAGQIAENVKVLLNRKVASYHALLRELSLIVRPRCMGRPWTAVSRELDAQGFKVVKTWENGAAINCEYLVATNAFTLPSGYSLDLHLMLQAENMGYATPTQHAGVVFNSDAALIANVNQPYSTLIAQKRFPQGSVLDQVLSTKEARDYGVTWPLVKRVHASYGYLYDRWSEYSPSGFKVAVEYQADPASDVGERHGYFIIASGLDPCRTKDGLASPEAFTAADTLGNVEERGYLESWHGDDKAIEQAKAKYLMKTKLPALHHNRN